MLYLFDYASHRDGISFHTTSKTVLNARGIYDFILVIFPVSIHLIIVYFARAKLNNNFFIVAVYIFPFVLPPYVSLNVI